jgi:hypothetical protein
MGLNKRPFFGYCICYFDGSSIFLCFGFSCVLSITHILLIFLHLIFPAVQRFLMYPGESRQSWEAPSTPMILSKKHYSSLFGKSPTYPAAVLHTYCIRVYQFVYGSLDFPHLLQTTPHGVALD